MVESGSYTPETIARRVKIAEALLGYGQNPQIQHWTQGLNELAKGAVGGNMLRRAEDMERQSRDEGNRAMMTALGLPAPPPSQAPPSTMQRIASMFGGAQGAPQASQAPTPPMPIPSTGGPAQPMNGAPNKIYSMDEPNPLDPPAPADRDRIVRTMLAEAGNQGPTGLGAVAGVIRNRSANSGATPGQVVTAPNQFEPWNTAAGRAKMAAISPNDPRYQQASAIVDQVYGGDDPSNGATHFYAPKAQAALGRNAPSWDNGTGTDIGDHRFFNLGYNGQGQHGIPQNAMALAPPQEGPPAVAAAMGAAPQAATPQAAGPLGNIPEDKRKQIAVLLSNPRTAPMGQAILQKALSGSEETNDIKEYNKAVAQGFKGSLFDYQVKLKEAGKPVTNINQQQESEFNKESGKLQAKRFDEMVQGGQTAGQMISDISALRDIGSRITTGKTAEIQAALGPYAEALGIKIDGLGDMQSYNAIISRLAPQMRVAGSGATSDFEMRKFLEALPGLGKTPEGNEIISKTFESIQQHKIAAADIASKAITGEIDRKEAEKQLRALPNPLELWKKTQGKTPTAKAGAPAAAPAGKPSIDDLIKKYGG